MPLAPWRSPLAHALHRNRALPYARYVQLATLRADRQPANRTVVFRGFLENTNRLRFITDSRSEKATQIQAQPWGEICWYFPKTREQFRILGQLTLVTADHADEELLKARKMLWHDLSDGGRSQFAWAYPRQPKTEPLEQTPPDPMIPLPTFCLLLLEPTQVDHLELRGTPQNRYLYSQQEPPLKDWSMEEVNP
ncbi:MAG: pyridoxamine 5'-phosphate oxidase [Leptolyngbyaceae cyanobacterium CSU_1_4]|nr:pyridoxamine 5'-phosphate oxidase [Leptolyngbyaceae cyanobacterium CSU_1_4]